MFKGISRVLPKLRKYFNSTAVSASIIPDILVLFIILDQISMNRNT